MKIGCLVPSVSREGGGVFESVRQLCRSLNRIPDTRVHVLGMADEHAREDLPLWHPVPTEVFPVSGPSEYGYAPELEGRLWELNADIVLTHGLWMYPTVAAQAWHHHTGRPFIVNPHGMLDLWALQRSAWKKRIAAFFQENLGLRKSACLRALCRVEAEAFRGYGLSNPICVIPNGVELPVAATGLPPPWRWKVTTGRKVLLYLGRIHPKKGIATLLRAWAYVQARNPRQEAGWDLVLAGWSQGNEEEKLKSLCRELALHGSVHFIGPQFGDNRTAAYLHADAFILPSLSEGLPMTVLEAWAHKLPVVMTDACHLPEGFAAEAAIRTDSNTLALSESLERLMAMSDPYRIEMGVRGRKLVAERFGWDRIGRQMRDVCLWVLGEGRPPDCVIGEGEPVPKAEAAARHRPLDYSHQP